MSSLENCLISAYLLWFSTRIQMEKNWGDTPSATLKQIIVTWLKEIFYEYWLHVRITLDIVTWRKPLSTEAKVDSGFWGVTISNVNLLCRIILNIDWIHLLHYIWFQNNLGQVNICNCISVHSNAQMRRSESMVNRSCINSPQSIFFLEYHL